MTTDLRRHLIAVHFWTERELNDFLSRHPSADAERIHSIEHLDGVFPDHDRGDHSDGTATA